MVHFIYTFITLYVHVNCWLIILKNLYKLTNLTISFIINLIIIIIRKDDEKNGITNGIFKKVELVDDVMHNLADVGIKGGTIVEGTGMAKSLASMDKLPMFGMLRYLLSDEEKLKCKILLLAIDEEQVTHTQDKIKEVVGDFNEPNTGVMFTIPIRNTVGFIDDKI